MANLYRHVNFAIAYMTCCREILRVQVIQNVSTLTTVTLTGYILLGVLPLALVVVVAEVEGSEMERLERSNIAFFTGLSLISSPDIYIYTEAIFYSRPQNSYSVANPHGVL